MSIRAMVWALDTPISDMKAKLVLVALADHADDKTMECWPSADHIAKRTGMSRRSVYRAISYLKTNDFLEHRQRRHTNGWRRGPLFILNVPKPSATQALPSANQSLPSATAGTTYEPSLNRQKERKREIGIEEKKEGFKASPHSAEFVAWRSYHRDNGNRAMCRELDKRELEGRAFNFEARWPPGYREAA